MMFDTQILQEHGREETCRKSVSPYYETFEIEKRMLLKLKLLKANEFNKRQTNTFSFCILPFKDEVKGGEDLAIYFIFALLSVPKFCFCS